MERSRNLDVLVRREREQRERSEGREIVSPSLMPAVEATRAEIERVLGTTGRQLVRMKNTQNA